jgi:polar amino acid transport system substrate-binding protein
MYRPHFTGEDFTHAEEAGMVRYSRPLLALTLIALFAGACGNAATTSPPPGTASSNPTAVTATGTPTGAPPTSSGAPSPSVTVVATIPAELLLFPDKLVICSDMPYPPQEYFDANGNPIGSDIEIGQEIARRLGLTAEIVNSVFDTIIPALTGGKCDIIISAQNINPERLGQVDMIPFFQAGQAFMVQAGNPANIQTTEDLCGKKIAVESGTTMLDYLGGTGAFLTNGLPATCTAAGKPAAEPQPYPKDSDAVAALQAGTVDAYMADLPVVIGYADAQPDAFMLAPVPQIAPAMEGISVGKSADPKIQLHTAIYDAVKTALLSMISDGTYLNILTKYQVQGGAITVDDVNAPLPSPAPSPSAT